MQEYLADLHIHSRFSRATSKKLCIPLLTAWARLKGLTVVGTGDFTHPKWREELRESLRFDEESGLYVLKDPESVAAMLPELPVDGAAIKRDKEKAVEDATGLASSPVHFMLQGEISSIYKKGDRVRKVHNLVFMPDLETAEKFSQRLGELGNLNADGRPILGLDSHDLLEMVLESHPEAFLVPAHIWTPWFSLFGSKSGFDRLEDCFGDLSDKIFALETGLSSDPAMNRLWSALDRYRLISNSDAHSGENLGREANVFRGKVSYSGMFKALRSPLEANTTEFLGTLEFFPEEGKYHMDGHRKCNVLLSPEETRKLGGLCPVCGGPVTVGVLNRVMELADRRTPEYQSPAERGECGGDLGVGSFASLVPLPEILAEILGVGSKSIKVRDLYAKVLERFGPELSILRCVPEAELAKFFPPLAEAVGRMRRSEVQLRGGYDGEYGVVRIFTPEEQREIALGAGVFSGKAAKRPGLQGLALPGTALREHMHETEKNPINEQGNVTKETQGSASSTLGVKENVGRQEDAPEEDDFIFETGDALAAEEQSEEEAGPCLPGLNSLQSRAAMAGPGPVLVLAGPGTGKTRTLIGRIAYLLSQGASPEKIVAVTFTRRAAAEMQRRLADELGPETALPQADTLHALALDLWFRTFSSLPMILSEESARRVFDEANKGENRQIRNTAWRALNAARESLCVLPFEFAHMEQRYSDLKRSASLADYTDLLEFWLERVGSGIYQCPWDHVLADEIQDLSPLQLTLLRDMLRPAGKGFFGIGDPDQSIYSFRGAHGKSREFFSLAWPDIQCIHLARNYRSYKEILKVSHAGLGEQASWPALIESREGNGQVSLFLAPSPEAEAVWIAEQASSLIGMGSHTIADFYRSNKQGRRKAEADQSPGDIAVLVRTHALGSVYRAALSRKGIPVSQPAADVFWADERVGILLEEIGGIFGIAASPPPPGKKGHMPPCPPTVLAKGPLAISAYLTEVPPFDAYFWSTAAFKGLVKAWDEHKDWASLLNWIHQQNELELVRAKGERVQILSMHAAKGLEFRTVFVPALEDGVMPFFGAGLFTGKVEEKKGPEQLLEEQRLFYVALSRAKDFLFLSCAKKRTLYGRQVQLKPSRFLDLLPKELLLSSTLSAESKQKAEQLKLI